MKLNKFIIAGAVLIGVVIAASISMKTGKTGHENHAGAGKVIYRCPMHPTYTSDRPGDCPICNMKLVKVDSAPQTAEQSHQHGVSSVEEMALDEICIMHKCTAKDCPMSIKAHVKPGERLVCPVCGEVIITESGKAVMVSPGKAMGTTKPSASAVTISLEKQQMIGVTTEPVKVVDLVKVVRASGKIAYDPELAVTQEEFIQALNVQDSIKDSPLADVVQRAKSLTDAARGKLKLLGMSEEQIVALEKSRKGDTSLYLPGAGESVWAYLSVYEYEIGFIKPGAEVDIEAVAYPGEKFSGTVVSVSPVLDAATRTNQVRVAVKSPDSKLKPEMFVSGSIQVHLGEKLAVPDKAVLDTGLRKIVYLANESDIIESREVTLGQRAQGYYEVLSGLRAGDIVVTNGNFLIDSESRLQNPSQPAEHIHGQ